MELAAPVSQGARSLPRVNRHPAYPGSIGRGRPALLQRGVVSRPARRRCASAPNRHGEARCPRVRGSWSRRRSVAVVSPRYRRGSPGPSRARVSQRERSAPSTLARWTRRFTASPRADCAPPSRGAGGRPVVAHRRRGLGGACAAPDPEWTRAGCLDRADGSERRWLGIANSAISAISRADVTVWRPATDASHLRANQSA